MPQHPARTQWLATRGSGTLQVVSSFYESATRTLVGGETPSDKQDGDVVLPDYTAAFEVKGSTSTNGFPVRWPQFRELERRMNEFPFDGAHGYYCLWSYSAQESRRGAVDRLNRRSLIRDMVVAGKGFEFLAERTRCLWIVPLSLIRELYGEAMETGPRDNLLLFPSVDRRDPMYGVRIRRKDLRALETRFKAISGSGKVTHHPNGNGGYPTSFEVVFLPHNGTPRPELQGVEWQI